ncbi:arylesterase/monooxygenase [Penicillium brasilianum]|uniref:Arylesterase/monooxygenase n=1 Tax=Penicillium brasilianum TaxID=104259 RepID=A0A1S9RYH8_PENBI|nr:arylesterase/monooxygenase [Penicillium brasilianum]
MALRYHPEFLKEAGPVLQQLARVPIPPLHDVTTRRALLASMTKAIPPLPEDIEKLVHHVATADGHKVVIYHFRQRSTAHDGAKPAVVHIHGGGYFSLTAEQCSVPHMASVSRTGVQILTIDYRLAPEHPYPVPLDDCWAALQWIHDNAASLSIDPARIALMGESAGGGLAAALTLKARDTGLSPPIAKQILIYPMLDDRTTTNHAGELAFWNEIDNITGWTAYVGSDAGTDKIDAYAAPARVESVIGLPPLYLDCPQLDIFVHEGLEYVRKFVKANVPTECHIYPGLPHGFEAFSPLAGVTQQAIDNRDRAMSSF